MHMSRWVKTKREHCAKDWNWDAIYSHNFYLFLSIRLLMIYVKKYFSIGLGNNYFLYCCFVMVVSKVKQVKNPLFQKAYRRYLFWENFHPIFLPMIWYCRWNSPSNYWNDLRLRRRRRLRSDVSSNVTILFMRNAAVKVKRNRKMLVSGL